MGLRIIYGPDTDTLRKKLDALREKEEELKQLSHQYEDDESHPGYAVVMTRWEKAHDEASTIEELLAYREGRMPGGTQPGGIYKRYKVDDCDELRRMN